MFGKKMIGVIVILFIIVLVFVFYKISDKKPILIGFVADLTGKQAELGVQERNGVQLAIEQINEEGGIDGRLIELIVRDDFGTPDQARIADQQLVDAGVVAIIGHATSGQTVSGLEVTEKSELIMISPTVSTPKLSGMDDNFFRVYPSFEESSKAFAKYVYEKNHITQIAIVYDSDNAAYAQTYCDTFSEEYKSFDGQITSEISYAASQQPDFNKILEVLKSTNPEALLIITSDIDAAFIAQATRLLEWDIPLYTSAWAQTQTLINNGGGAVEGMILEQSYALASQSPTFLAFETSFKKRFGINPSFGAAFGYEAAQVLIEALGKTEGDSSKLKHALLGIKDFEGVVDTFSFDEYGDVERPFYLSTIENGEFTVIERLTIAQHGGE